MITTPFTDEEMTALLEVARVSLDEMFDALTDKLDLDGETMGILSDKLEAFMSSDRQSYTGPTVVCEISCQKPSVSVHPTWDEAMERAVECAMENLAVPDLSDDDAAEARMGFRHTLGEYECVTEGDYEVHILTPSI